MSQISSKLSRRTLFAGAGTLGAIAATASLVTSVGGAITPAAPQAPPVPARGGGYRLSEHVKRYYKTTLV